MKEGLLAPAGGTLQAVGLSSRVMITFLLLRSKDTVPLLTNISINHTGCLYKLNSAPCKML